MPTLTFRDSLAQFFRDRPGQWIDGMVLANVGGCYAYRTRISDLRTQLGMQIENRQRRVGRRVVSEYRFVPPVRQADLLSAVSAREGER